MNGEVQPGFVGSAVCRASAENRGNILILGCYGPENRLLWMKQTRIQERTEAIDFVVPAQAGSLKLFMWDSLKEMRPAGRGAELKVKKETF